MPLPRYKPSEVRAVTGASAVAHQAKAQTWESLSQTLELWGDVAFKEAKEIRTQEGKEQAVIDVQKGEFKTPESGYTVYDKAYKDAGHTAYSLKTKADAKDYADNLVIELSKNPETRNNPEVFRKTYQKYSQAILADSPDEYSKAIAQQTLSVYEDATANNLAKDRQEVTFKQDKETYIAGLKLLESEFVEAVKNKEDDKIIQLSEQIASLQERAIAEKWVTEESVKVFGKEIAQKAYTDKTIVEFKEAMENGKAEKYIESFEKKKHSGIYDEQEKIKVKNLMLSEYSKKLKLIKADQSLNTKQNTITVDEAIKVNKDGKIPTNEKDADKAVLTLSEKKQHEYFMAKAVRAEVSKNQHLSFLEIEEKLNEREADKTQSAFDVELTKELRATFNAKKTLAKKDHISLAVQDEIISDEGIVSWDDVSMLSGRILQSDMASDQYGTPANYLKLAEVDGIVSKMNDIETTVDEKMEFLESIEAIIPENSDVAYRQLFKKGAGTYAFAGNMLTNGNKEVARLSILGKNADVALEPDFQNTLKNKLAGVYGGYGSDTFNQNYQGILSYAKGLALNGEPTDDFEAIVTNSIGEIETYNNKKVIIPYGVDKDDFEDWLDGIEIPGRPILSKGLQDMTDMFATGNYQLHHAGSGKYYVKIVNDGSSYFARDTEDKTKPFVLDYKQKDK